MTDGAIAQLTRDELEAVCAAQLAIAHDATCRRLEGASTALRIARVVGFVGAVPAIVVLSVGFVSVGLPLLALVSGPEAAGWLFGARVRWWSSVAADAVCVRTTRHPEALVSALRALARWRGDHVPTTGLAKWTGAGGAMWAIPVGPRWTSTTSVNGRTVAKKSSEMVEDTRLLLRAGLVRSVCLGGAEASLASYETVQAAVDAAGRAAAQGGTVVVEGELVGMEGVVARGTPAGWYPDPTGQARLRWWDGTRWTEQTA